MPFNRDLSGAVGLAQLGEQFRKKTFGIVTVAAGVEQASWPFRFPVTGLDDRVKRRPDKGLNTKMVKKPR
jgi:hypothetical protein